MLCRHRVTVGLIIQVVALHLAVVYGKGGGGGGSAGGGGGKAAGGSGRGTTRYDFVSHSNQRKRAADFESV